MTPGLIPPHHRPCQHLPALVPDAHQIAISNTARFRVIGCNVTGSRPATAYCSRREE
jgi:hypothetical protein